MNENAGPIATLNMKLNELSCASCATRARSALLSVDGVVNASVNLATEIAYVEYIAPADLEKISTALDVAGYPAERVTVVLSVDAMSCASCSGRVDRLLRSISGVLEVRVNLALEQAYVTFLKAATSSDEIVEKMRHTNYAVQVHSAENTELISKKINEFKFIRVNILLAVLLAFPVVILEMVGHISPAFHMWIDQTIGLQASYWIQFLLTSAVMIGPGRLFFIKGFRALLNGTPEMNALVAMGTSAAYLYSIVSLLAPNIFPVGTANVYFEAAAVIIVFILMGRWMEARAKGQTGDAILALTKLTPDTAVVAVEHKTVERPVAQLLIGEHVVIYAGARVPVDCKVIEGESYVNESMITGESHPVHKSPGSCLTGGTVNGNGVVKALVSAVGKDTVLSQIQQIVENAQATQLPIQTLVDKVTAIFVPAVIVIASLTVALWLLLSNDVSLAMVAGVSVLIIACPCAMGLATPTSIMVGTGRAAQLGILFRRAQALQLLQAADVVAFDKTGTLTMGVPEITTFRVEDGMISDDVLSLIAAIEGRSEHPLAGAIMRRASQRSITPAKVENVQVVPGFGISGDAFSATNKYFVQIGSLEYLQKEGIQETLLTDLDDQLQAQGQSVFFAAIDGKIAACIGVCDPLKPDALELVNTLRAMGKKIAILTGDSQGGALAVAQELQINHVFFRLRPEEKVHCLKTLQGRFGQVAFVGDGINDAPALACADVGIAIGSGTDVAIETADVVLSSTRLMSVANSFEISRSTMRNIKQNLFWAFGYNILLIPVAAGVLFPIWGVLLSPMLGAGAMAISSVVVLLNALRLRSASGTETI